jgi:hypothetical protein
MRTTVIPSPVVETASIVAAIPNATQRSRSASPPTIGVPPDRGRLAGVTDGLGVEVRGSVVGVGDGVFVGVVVGVAVAGGSVGGFVGGTVGVGVGVDDGVADGVGDTV